MVETNGFENRHTVTSIESSNLSSSAKRFMKILAIETSCDETALAVLEIKGKPSSPSFSVLSHHVASQIALHTQYGGVFPAMAKREHAKNIVPLFKETMEQCFSSQKFQVKSQKIDPKKIKKLEKILEREREMFDALVPLIQNLKKPKIDAIAVTTGPGLEPTLWVGINFARALSYIWNIPVIPVNHMEGHILSIFPKKKGKEFSIGSFQFPVLSLLVSGGHTEIVLVKGWGKYKVIGQTKDDAVGEAFDKVARMMDLPYPGGPEISKFALDARREMLKADFKLPRPMLHTPNFDFSFSGLKTAVLYLIRDMGKLVENDKKKIAREFEDAAIEVLTVKTMKALKKYKAGTLIVGGGVAANSHLRSELVKATTALQDTRYKTRVYFPTKELTTDNAIMIGIAGGLQFTKANKGISYTSKKLVADGNMSL